MQGVIKFYNQSKAYGFIAPDDGSDDVFFHITGVKDQMVSPYTGDRVMFDIGTGRDSRPKAVNVIMLAKNLAGDTRQNADDVFRKKYESWPANTAAGH